MKEIELQNVKRWITTNNSNISHPASISAVCPGCHINAAFATRRRHYDAQRDTLAFSSECPACNLVTHFWMTDISAQIDEKENETTALYMLPATESRMNLSSISELLPDNAMQYCASTQAVFESGNFTATQVMVQSTLDSIFNSLLPLGNSHTTLFKTAQSALPSLELDEPLQKLTTSLRAGEPLDLLLKNPDLASHESAEVLMKLVEKLVNFLYVIPREFHDLDQQITKLSQQLPPSRSATSADTEKDSHASSEHAPDEDNNRQHAA